MKMELTKTCSFLEVFVKNQLGPAHDCGNSTANNHELITVKAGDEWGFQGVVMTDWGTTGGLEAIQLDSTMKLKYGCSSAAGCIKAGNNLIMPGKQEDVDEIIRSVGATEGVTCPLILGELQCCAMHIYFVKLWNLLNGVIYV